MKKSPIKKKSKQSISKIQRKIWEHCKRLIRQMYPPFCYTCGRGPLSGSNLQTGHMWAKASLGAILKYDLRILRPQCMTCNLWQGGRGADFYKRMLQEIGEDKMKELELLRNKTVKALDYYIKILNDYEQR